MDREYEHDDEGVNGHRYTNGYKRASQRQLEKAPEGRLPHPAGRGRSYLNSNGTSTVRGVPRPEHDYDGGGNAKSHIESLSAPGPAPTESKFAEEL